MDLDIAWKEFYKYCTEKIGKEDKTVGFYLESCLPVSLEDGVLTIDVPTLFSRDQINERYLEKMKELIAETGFGTDIKLIVSESENIPKQVRKEKPNHS